MAEFSAPDRDNLGGGSPTAGASGDAGVSGPSDDGDDVSEGFGGGGPDDDDDDREFRAPDRDNLGGGDPTAGTSGDAGVEPEDGASDEPVERESPPEQESQASGTTFDGSQGLENELGSLSGEEGPRADAVQTLQGRVDRRVAGVDISDTDQYNIVRTGSGSLAVRLSPQARRRRQEQRVEQAIAADRVEEPDIPTEEEIAAADDPSELPGLVAADNERGYRVAQAVREQRQTAQIQQQVEAAREEVAQQADVNPENVTVDVEGNQIVARVDDPGGSGVAASTDQAAAAGVVTDRMYGSADRGRSREDVVYDEGALAESFQERGEAAAEQRGEQFGDIDWSAGYGGDEDEVEQLLDETVAGGVADLTRGADRAVEDIQSSDAAESGVPIVVPGQGATGTYSPAFLGAELAEDVLEGADEAGRVPGYALEAAETAAYVTGQIDESADASPGQRPPMLFTDPLTATVIGGVASAAEQPDQTERRGEAVGTVAETAAREGAEYAAENPRDVGRTALAGVAISAAGGAAVRGTSTAARLGSTATRGSRVDVDVDGDGVVADSGGPLGRVVETARERTPSVRVRRDPDAPTLQFDPELQRQIRDTITPDVSGAARRAGRRTRVAEINAQLQAGEAVARSRQVVGGVSERVRGVETPEVRLDDVTEGARTAARRVEEEADIRASNTISRTRERVERTVDRGRDAADVDVDVGVPRGRADTTTTDVFGRPEIERRLGSELRETGASVRGRGAGAVETAADAAQRVSSGVASVRGFSVGARSRLGGGADTTTADVFGRPELQSRIASEISDTGARIRSAMDRDIDMPETAADTTTADVFGRPQYPGVASAEIRSAREALADIRGGVAGRAAAAQERLSDARDLSVQVGPVRPRRAYVPDDVDEDDLLGPYADEDLGDLPAFNEEVDVDVDTSGSGATSGMPGQGSALRMRMDRGDRDTARAPADETGQRADSLLPPVIPGVNERATDPVRGALNRVGAAMEPSVTPTDSVDRGTTLTDYTATDLDTTVGGEGTGLGFGTDLDVGPVTSPRFTDLFDVDQPTRVDQTPTTTPTTTTDVDQTPTYREGEATIRPPRTPEADLPFDNDASGPEDTPDVDEETDVFGSGIIDNPFSRV